jgi:hypothetical protein
MAQESIVAAGNTKVPAYLTLIELGYSVDRIDKDGEERWTAKKGTLQLMADCPLELLGLSLLRSERGSRWQASDNEIAEFLTKVLAVRWTAIIDATLADQWCLSMTISASSSVRRHFDAK